MAWGATLTWDANTDRDLAGYRIYQCSLIPCGPGSGHHTLLANLGAVTSFNIGTPTVTQYYFITAVDSANNESQSSNLITYTPPASAPPLPTPLKTVDLAIAGNPVTGQWGVASYTDDPRDIMAMVRLDGLDHHVDHDKYYSFPGDNGVAVTTGKFGTGSHKVEFVFYLEGTTTEVGRASITVQEGSATPLPLPPLKTVKLAIAGNPATGSWGIASYTDDPRDIMAMVRLDGLDHHVDHNVYYSFPGDNGVAVTTGKFGSGSHKVEFVYYLEGTTSEVGRASLTVHEGSQ